MKKFHSLILLVVCCNLVFISTSHAQISFVEATPATFISRGLTFGSHWGDLNSDGCPDLWVSGHTEKPTLYLNQCDGNFVDVFDKAWPDYSLTDAHGAQWADFDNDGDQDLFQSNGSGQNRFLVNIEKNFNDMAKGYNLIIPNDEQQPLWFDWNNDGLLDLLLAMNQFQSARLMEQSTAGMIDVTPSSGIQTNSRVFLTQLTNFNLDLHPELIIADAGGSSYPWQIYDTETIPYLDIRPSLRLPRQSGVRDVAFVDFNNDGLTDVFMARGYDPWDNAGLVVCDAAIVDDYHLKTFIHIQPAEYQRGIERGISFKAAGVTTFYLYKQGRDVSKADLYDVYLGTDGHHPVSWPIVLDPANPVNWGIKPHQAGVDHGIFIGFDSVAKKWTLVFSRAIPLTVENSSKHALEVRLIVEASNQISDLERIGFDAFKGLPDKLLINSGAGFLDKSGSLPVTGPTPCRSVVATDFDNDMDIDIYMLCSSSVANVPNILYANQGNGIFLKVPLAGGAEGTRLGVGDTVTAVDYDGNGFMDLFLTNSAYPNQIGADGPHQLFRNIGNSNTWLELDLEGVASNRDGIGATVKAKIGSITQTRMQDGGVHNRSQNYQRLHFGFAQYKKVNSVIIYWPSGIVQELKDTPVNQLLHIIEPVAMNVLGQPSYTPGVSDGVYLWKDNVEGPYYLRISGGGQAAAYQVKLLSSEPLGQIRTSGLGAGDEWTPGANGFTLKTTVNYSESSVDFHLPRSAKVMIAVEKDGKPNPRQLHVGAASAPLSPAGWIVSSDKLSVRPDDREAGKWGLFIGQGTSPNQIEARWRADANTHSSKLTLITSSAAINLSTLSFEGDDKLVQSGAAIDVAASSGAWYMDGVIAKFAAPVEMAIAFQQDKLFPPHRVNPVNGKGAFVGPSALGLPNAYWLQLPSPVGAPSYDPNQERGLFLWQEANGLWRLRATAGGDSKTVQYRGVLRTDQAARKLSPLSLESNDIADMSDPRAIRFDLHTNGPWQDGLDIQLPAGVKLTLELDPATATADSIRLGREKWPVSQTPMVILAD